MGNTLTEKTVSLNEFSDSQEVAGKAGDESPAVPDSDGSGDSPVAVSAVEKPRFEPAEPDEVDAAIAKSISKNQPILDYLKDK